MIITFASPTKTLSLKKFIISEKVSSAIPNPPGVIGITDKKFEIELEKKINFISL